LTAKAQCRGRCLQRPALSNVTCHTLIFHYSFIFAVRHKCRTLRAPQCRGRRPRRSAITKYDSSHLNCQLSIVTCNRTSNARPYKQDQKPPLVKVKCQAKSVYLIVGAGLCARPQNKLQVKVWCDKSHLIRFYLSVTLRVPPLLKQERQGNSLSF